MGFPIQVVLNMKTVKTIEKSSLILSINKNGKNIENKLTELNSR